MTTETPVKTPLGEIAGLLLDVQRLVGAARRDAGAIQLDHVSGPLSAANDKLAEVRILVDVLRGDGT